MNQVVILSVARVTSQLAVVVFGSRPANTDLPFQIRTGSYSTTEKDGTNWRLTTGTIAGEALATELPHCHRIRSCNTVPQTWNADHAFVIGCLSDRSI